MPLTKIVDIPNFLKRLREYEKTVVDHCRVPAPFFRRYINAEFHGRNGDEMSNAIWMDTEKIRERMSGCVVIGFDISEIGLMMPTYGDRWINLTDGKVWDANGLAIGSDWIIRAGDKAIFGKGVNEKENIFRGFSMDLEFPFAVDGNAFSYIRPMPKDSPEKIEAIRRLEQAEASIKCANHELAEARKQVEEMD